MPLTALFIIDDTDCAFSILGVPIVEFQIRQAMAVGARHAVLMVGRMPPVLLATTDRLRREGLGIDIARSVSDVLDFVHPDDRVLLAASRVAVAQGDMLALARGTGAMALAIAASVATARLDIIDGDRRWTGWAGFDGRFLRNVGAAIGDWDLAPTILRRLLQAGNPVSIATTPVNLLDRPDERAVVERRLRVQSEVAAEGSGEALIVLPAARHLVRLAGDAGLRPKWLGRAALATALAGLALGIAGRIVASSAVMLIAGIGWQAASIMARAMTGRPMADRRVEFARNGLPPLAMTIAGVDAMRVTGQWGCVVLALMLIAALLILQTPLVRARNALVMADAPGSLVLIGVFDLAGVPALGLGLAALHASLSVASRQIVPPWQKP